MKNGNSPESAYKPAQKAGGVVTTTRIGTEDPGFVNIASHFGPAMVEKAKKIASKRNVPYEIVLDEWRRAIL